MDTSNESSETTPKPTPSSAAPPAPPISDEAADLLSALKPNQVIVIRAIWRGLSYVDAAQEGNVGRNSVYRWRKRDPNFRAALNGWTQEQVGSARSILTAALPAAATRFANYATHYPDAALKLLDRFKVFEPANGGTTAGACTQEIQIEQSKEQIDYHKQLSDIQDQQASIHAKESQRRLKQSNATEPEPADDGHPSADAFPSFDPKTLLKEVIAEWKKEADERDDLEEDEEDDDGDDA